MVQDHDESMIDCITVKLTPQEDKHGIVII